MRRFIVAFAFIALAMFAFALVADCSTSSRPPSRASGSGQFERLLALMPDTPETRKGVTLVDHVRFRDLIDQDVPVGPIDDAADGQYRLEVQARLRFDNPQLDLGLLWVVGGSGPLWNGFGEYGRMLIHPSTVGYSPANIDGEVYAGPEGKRYFALSGRFEPSRSDEAVRTSAACKNCPKADVWSYKGTRYYAWGADLQTDPRRRLRMGYDEKGRTGRMFFAQDRVLRAEWTAGIEHLIDAPNGASLATNPGFKLVAQRLNALDSYIAYITTETQGSSNAASSVPVLRPYTLLGVGQGSYNNAPYMSLVLVHASPDLARANVDLLKQRIAQLPSTLHRGPWAQAFTSVEVWSDGNLLLAKLHGNRDWTRFIEQGDPLLLHE